MPSLASYRRSNKLQALVFGGYKSGKTAGAATFPNSVIIDCDKGIGTLTNPNLARFGYEKKVVHYEQFKDAERTNRGVVTKHTAFDNVCKYFDEWMKPAGKWPNPDGTVTDTGRDKFETWIIDSGTTLGDYAKAKAIILLGGTDFSAKPLSHTHAAAVRTGMIVPKLQDFGAERSMLEQFIDMLLDSDKHVVLLSHEREQWEGEPPNEKIVAITPMFTGQSAERIPLKFEEVWNLRVMKEGTGWRRYLQTEADGLRKCGSRLGLPDKTPFEFEVISKALNLSGVK